MHAGRKLRHLAIDQKKMSHLINIYSLFAGYVLYLRNEVDRAVKFFQRCALMSLSQQKAASLIMLGCCCAIKVRIKSNET